ncbi:hypothetical protein WN943_006069 [Citrus x changshan-huyou]
MAIRYCLKRFYCLNQPRGWSNPTNSLISSSQVSFNTVVLYPSRCTTPVKFPSCFHSYTFTPLMPQFDANKRFVKAIGSQSEREDNVSLELFEEILQSMEVGISFRDYNGRISSMNFHKSSSYLVTASDDESIRPYDVSAATNNKVSFEIKGTLELFFWGSARYLLSWIELFGLRNHL